SGEGRRARNCVDGFALRAAREDRQRHATPRRVQGTTLMDSSAVYEFQHDPATGVYRPMVRENKMLLPCIAAAQPGPQLALMQDDSTEISICGSRGSSKTTIIILKILSGIGRGW